MINKYELTADRERELLKDAIIIFDTSALLDFYYYSEKTRNDIFNNVFTKLKSRLWLPAQVYFEFCRNRKKVLLKPIQTYKDLVQVNQNNKDSGHAYKIEESINSIISKDLKNIKMQIQTMMEKTKNDDKHPYLDHGIFMDLNNAIAEYENNTNNFKNKFSVFRTNFLEKINCSIQELEKKAEDDFLFEKINELFTIGQEYTYSKVFQIVQEGKIRYENEIPPGYEDQDDKSGFQIYGDLICWKQILDYGKSVNKPVLLVSNDAKEDWIEEREDIKRPRYELIKEFWDEANNDFWIFNSKNFLYKINSILEEKLESSVIDEVQEIQKIKLESMTEIDKVMLFHWVENYFGHYSKIEKLEIEASKLEDNKISEVLYNVIQEDGEDLLVHIWKTSRRNYTALLNPLRRSRQLREKFIESGQITKFVLLIIVANNGVAKNFVERHLTRYKVQEVLNESFRVMIGYEDSDKNIVIYYDFKSLRKQNRFGNIPDDFTWGSPCQMSGQHCPSCGEGLLDVARYDEGVDCSKCGAFYPSL